MKRGKVVIGKSFVAGLLGIAMGISLLIYGKSRLNNYLIIVFGLMIVLGVLLICSTLSKRNDSLLERISIKEIALILLLFINPLIGKVFGFYSTAFLEIFLFSLLTEKEIKLKVFLKTVLISLVITILAYVIFSFLLKIHCPTGSFHLI